MQLYEHRWCLLNGKVQFRHFHVENKKWCIMQPVCCWRILIKKNYLKAWRSERMSKLWDSGCEKTFFLIYCNISKHQIFTKPYGIKIKIAYRLAEIWYTYTSKISKLRSFSLFKIRLIIGSLGLILDYEISIEWDEWKIREWIYSYHRKVSILTDIPAERVSKGCTIFIDKLPPFLKKIYCHKISHGPATG